MYKLREQRLREMVQNDEESLGALGVSGEEVSLVTGNCVHREKFCV